MANSFSLFMKAPARNTQTFAHEAKVFANAAWKSFFSKDHCRMAEDFHAFAKYESGRKRKRLAIFYLKQEIRGLGAQLDGCSAAEKAELDGRLFQAHCNLAAIHFWRGTESSLEKACKCFTRASHIIPRLDFNHPMRRQNGAPLSLAKAKALYLLGKPGPALMEADSAWKGYVRSKNAGEEILGGACFLLGELNLELHGVGAAEGWYKEAMGHLAGPKAGSSTGPLYHLAASRIWDFEYYEKRWNEVADHNSKVREEWASRQIITDPWDPARFEYTNKKTGETRHTDPRLCTPSAPTPGYENEKMNFLRTCPVPKIW
ncbi:MAG: hypothetical protein WC263_00915 [Candidatus Micrarchaeia archaeon]|jgi:hypothetical protein